jgi:hypothetical protein
VRSFRPGCALAWLLVVALLLGGPASVEAQKPSAALSSLGSAAEDVLVCNATAATVRYETRRKGQDRGTVNDLPPGNYHLFSGSKDLVCRHGDPVQQTPLVAGCLFQFRAGAQGSGKVVLIRLEIRPPGDASARERTVELEKEVRRLEGKVRALQQELEQARAKKPQVKPAAAVPGQVSELSGPARPSSGADTVTILSYPPGPAYLVDLSSRNPWTRTYLGRAPLQCRLGPGAYQILLEQPAAGPGRWAAPSGRPRTVGFGSRSASCLEVDLTKEERAPALVRALWLAPAGSMVDRLDRATRDAGELFPDLPTDAFLRFCTGTLARARVALGKEEGDRLAAILRRVGWLRYEVDAGTALDFEHVGASKEPFRVKVVRLSR